MPLRYLSALLGSSASAAPAEPSSDEAWSWRRTRPSAPSLALRHRDGSLAELRPLRPKDRIQWVEGMPSPRGLPADLRTGSPVPGGSPTFAWALLVRRADGWWGVARGELTRLGPGGPGGMAVAVHPDHRGRGFERLLVRALASSAAIQGFDTVRVQAPPDDPFLTALAGSLGLTLPGGGPLASLNVPLESLGGSSAWPELQAELQRLTRCVEGRATSPLRIADPPPPPRANGSL